MVQNKETGWSEFDLRMYDRRFGRWISPDPYEQFESPYLAMGNNPVSGVDPDGGKALDWFRNAETGAVIWNASTVASISIEGVVYNNIGKFFAQAIDSRFIAFYENSRDVSRIIDLQSDIGTLVRAVYTETGTLDSYLGRKIVAEVMKNRLNNDKEFKNQDTYKQVAEAPRGKKMHQFQFMDNEQKKVYEDIVEHSKQVEINKSYELGGNMLLAESIEVSLKVDTREILKEKAYFFYHAKGHPGGSRVFKIDVPEGTSIKNLYGIKGY
ncbi:MAG: hypothetical protein KF775_14435 [Cyclobacteriaceae bacterium]|nr:hypothetical protein [Cyclobacteriaceae bacterium]